MLFNKRSLAFSALGLFLIADRFLKFWAENHPWLDKNLFKNIFHFGYYPNPRLLFIADLPSLLAIGAMLSAFIFLFIFFSNQTPPNHLPFYFIFAGALSNFYDRLTQSVVIDYFKFFNLNTANFADVLIFIGLIMFVVKFYKHQ